MCSLSFINGNEVLKYTEQAYQLFCSHRFSPWSKNAFIQSMQNPFSLVACQQSKLIGYIIVTSVLDEAEIEDICIDPEYRQQGLASRLIEEACKKLLIENIASLYLEVAETNCVATSLYSKLNFKQIGIRKNYYNESDKSGEISGNKKVNAIVMKRELSRSLNK